MIVQPGSPPPPPPGGPPRGAAAASGSGPRRFVLPAVAVVAIVLVVRACAGRENTYEEIAHKLTAAVQNNDLGAVQRLENDETAAEMSHARLGRAADQLAPLGKIDRVKETPVAGDRPRMHDFDVTFEKGRVHEQITFDPKDKVFHFHYDPPTAK